MIKVYCDGVCGKVLHEDFKRHLMEIGNQEMIKAVMELVNAENWREVWKDNIHTLVPLWIHVVLSRLFRGSNFCPQCEEEQIKQGKIIDLDKYKQLKQWENEDF